MVKDSFYQFFRFSLIGLISTLCHISVLTILVEVFKAEPLVASVYAFLAAVSVSYVLNRNWTFKSARLTYKTQFTKYFLVCCVGLLINTGLMFFLVTIKHIQYLASQFVVIGFVTPTNFLLNKHWTFSDKEEKKEAN